MHATRDTAVLKNQSVVMFFRADYLPRKLDFATITDEQLRRIEQQLNTRPRKILGFKTPLDIFVGEFNSRVANQS